MKKHFLKVKTRDSPDAADYCGHPRRQSNKSSICSALDHVAGTKLHCPSNEEEKRKELGISSDNIEQIPFQMPPR